MAVAGRIINICFSNLGDLKYLKICGNMINLFYAIYVRYLKFCEYYILSIIYKKRKGNSCFNG